jgi:hypothetical protein
LVVCALLSYYVYKVNHKPVQNTYTSKPLLGAYEVNACRVMDPTTQRQGLLIPVNEWGAQPAQTSLLINGCIYVIQDIERKTDFYQLNLVPEHTYVFSDGLQGIEMDKWFKLQLLR